MGQTLNTGAIHGGPTRRAILGGAGILAAVASAPTLASLPSVSVFEQRLAAWKVAHARFGAVCDDRHTDAVVNARCRQATDALYALLAEPAPDARGVAEKLHALCQQHEGCEIPTDDVERIGAEAAIILKRGR
jgi:hypothetical protein